MPRGELSTEDAHDEAGSGRDSDPGWRHATGARLTDRTRRRQGEFEDAGRLVGLLEPAHDLRLLRGQPLDWERLVDGADGDALHIIEPSTDVEHPARTVVALVDVPWPLTRQHRIGEGGFIEMSPTNYPINESHVGSFRLPTCALSHRRWELHRSGTEQWRYYQTSVH